jgi:threonine dehydrogenase-like Zn-dependent dehydrogenase
MKALVLDTPGAIALRDVSLPSRDGECRVRITMAGICGTDLQLVDGYAGFHGIPGHEFVGVVDAVSSADDESWLGKRVVGEINVGCGRCRWCKAGIKEHCTDRAVVGIRDHDGAFAEALTLPTVNLHHIPDVVSDDAAVFVEPIAAACRIFEQVAIDQNTSLAVLGDGRMGLLVAQVLKTATSALTVLGRHEHKLEVARSLGLAARRSDGAVSASHKFDVVVDVTGRAEGLRRSLEIVRPRGTVVLKSTVHGEASLVSWPIVVDEISIVGSRCGPFRPALELLASGAIQVKPLISRIAPLEDHEAAFAEARRALKVLFAIA